MLHFCFFRCIGHWYLVVARSYLVACFLVRWFRSCKQLRYRQAKVLSEIDTNIVLPF